MEAILLGVVLTKVPLTGRDNINQTWKADIRSEEGDFQAIVKDIPERELVVECLCAVLGRRLGLPIPRPMLVEDAELGILFGSEELSHPDLKRAELSTYLMTILLSDWPRLPLATVFDEWIANPDRHGGNLLWDGNGEFWLIDHGLALADALPPEQKLKNYLLDFATALADNDLKKQKLLNQLAQNIPQNTEAIQAISPLFFSDESMLQFLQKRSPMLYTLLRKTVLNHDEIPGF